MQCDFDDHWHEECGVFGIYGDPEAAEKTYLGLYALQHRGQESAGIASTDGTTIALKKGLGLCVVGVCRSGCHAAPEAAVPPSAITGIPPGAQATSSTRSPSASSPGWA